MPERLNPPHKAYRATWLSPSSLADYDKCPRLYWLHNVFKHPRSGRKIQIVNPHLSLGSAVHTTLESIRALPREKRQEALRHLEERFEGAWKNVSGTQGGFTSQEEEQIFGQRGRNMIQRVQENPRFLSNLALKVPTKEGEKIPTIWLSEDDELVLCGAIDWIEYLEDEKAMHIIDFKTGRTEESGDSLQLPIYLLILSEKMKTPVARMSYWYLDQEGQPLVHVELPNLEEVTQQLIEKGRTIKALRAQEKIECSTGGCRHCTPYESVLSGHASFVGVDYNMRKDLYLVKKSG